QRSLLPSTGRKLLLGIADAHHAFKSVMRMMATARLSLKAVSFVPLLQVQAKFFLPVKLFPSCSRRSSPSRIWQTMAFIIGSPTGLPLDPGCTLMSRLDTALHLGISDGLPPQA